MSEPAITTNQSVRLVHPIKAAVDGMLEPLQEPSVRKEFDKIVGEKLANGAILGEFTHWLKEAQINSAAALKWINFLKPGKIEQAIEKGIAWDCLQVVVLAYLPGPRYFQGAYIKSALRDDAVLEQMKAAVQVPHLSGAVGWMSAHLLNPETPRDSYVTLQDAQLDLRGRVAVSDLQLGNRSVAGFAVSMGSGNTDLSSISGFVFLSHPLAGVFPEPLDDTVLSRALVQVRRLHESALASAIESYIFRRYGRFVLSSREVTKMDEPVPLLTLSHDDPTGFLASILFESNPAGLLSAECDVNEDVFLEIAAWHLRVANMYPEKWAPRFVQHMTRLGDVIERPAFDGPAAMAWYPRSAPSTVRDLYPSEAVSHLTASLNHIGETMTWPDWNTGWPDQVSNRLRTALADILQVYGTPSEQTYQADLVVPVCYERDGIRHTLGFFRINCDSCVIPNSKSAPPAFHNLWCALVESRRSISTEIGKLLFALEQEYLVAVDTQPTQNNGQSPERQRATEIQRIKLWMDISHLISDWLAQRMHQLVALLTDSQRVPDPDEDLILFAMRAWSGSGESQLTKEFEACRDKWKELLDQFSGRRFGDLFPEITLVSFWPRMKLSVINNVHQVAGKPGAEDELATLLLADPGLLRMITILAPILQPGESLDLSQGSARHGEPWGNVDFGVPTTRDILSLRVERPTSVSGTALDLTWRRDGEHGLRLTWDDNGGRRRVGSHAVSNVAGTVARRLGKNILDGLEMALPPANLHKPSPSSIDPNQYHSILDFIASPDGAALTERIRRIERVMFFGKETDTAGSWRMLEVKSQPRAFLAALCDQHVKRPIVLAFRDFALAQAKAFHVAREFDSQRKAAQDYAQNLSAVAHGYKGPVLKLVAALEQAAADFRDNRENIFVSDRMGDLQTMAKGMRTLAEDAISYAWRKTLFKGVEPMGWKRQYDGQDGLKDCIEVVIRALDLPHRQQVSFEERNLKGDLVVDSSPFLWRHLLSKLIENALEHTTDDQNSATSHKVFLRTFLEGASSEASGLVLEIRNFVPRDDLATIVARVGAGLKEGIPDPNRPRHGYGLIEAFNCCTLLLIKPRVSGDNKQSHLIIELPMALKQGEAE